jgi:hypothetical protein
LESWWYGFEQKKTTAQDNNGAGLRVAISQEVVFIVAAAPVSSVPSFWDPSYNPSSIFSGVMGASKGILASGLNDLTALRKAK